MTICSGSRKWLRRWRHTAAFSIASLGWKELGPSSHRYPSSLLQLVRLPPTRSRPSVSRQLTPGCSAANACAAGLAGAAGRACVHGQSPALQPARIHTCL